MRAQGLLPGLDVEDAALLVDYGPSRDRGAGQSQAIVQRMKMACATLAQRAVVDPRAKAFLEFGLCKDPGVGVAQRVILVLPFLQPVELSRFRNGMDVTPDQVAIDLVLGDPIDDQPLRLFGEVEALSRVVLTELRLDLALTRREAGADLTAIPARSPIAHGFGLEDHDPVAGLRQFQGSRQAGEARTDDADIGVDISCKGRVIAMWGCSGLIV